MPEIYIISFKNTVFPKLVSGKTNKSSYFKTVKISIVSPFCL